MKLNNFFFRWVATFLAFPIGGAISQIVIGPSNSIPKALGGGLVVGVAVGLIQFVAMKKYGISQSWITATAVAMTLAALVNSFVFDFKFDTTSLVGMGMISGLFVGIGQSLSHSREMRFVMVWTVCTGIAWSLAWFITSKVIVDPEAQYHVFGSSGALVATVGLGIILKFFLPTASPLNNSIE
jgi:hypothetical protein